MKRNANKTSSVASSCATPSAHATSASASASASISTVAIAINPTSPASNNGKANLFLPTKSELCLWGTKEEVDKYEYSETADKDNVNIILNCKM